MNQVTAGACHIASFRCAGAKIWPSVGSWKTAFVWKTWITVLHFSPKSKTLGSFSLSQKHCWQHL